MTERELDLASRVADLVRSLGGPGAQAEVWVQHSELSLTRFANSAIHQNVSDTAVRIRLRVHVDGRTAAGSTTLIDRDGLTGLVERTLAAARLCPPDAGWPGLAQPAPVRADTAFDEATAAADPAERASRVRDFVAAAGGLETAGFCRTAWRAAAFVNSAGQSAWGRSADAAMDGIARSAGADGVARVAAGRLAEIDGTVLGSRAGAKAHAGVDPVELPPGEYEVVLEPAAVADVLSNLAVHGFNGRDFVERQSFAEPGAAQFDRSVTLVDDAAGTPALPFDGEGTPRDRLVLVEAGVTRSAAHDRRTAAEAGAASTGNQIPGSPWGPMPTSLRLEPDPGTAGAADAPVAGVPAGVAAAGVAAAGMAAAGPPPAEVAGPAADSEVAQLVSGVRRGLLVSDFWYTRVLDPKSLVITGLTRNGVWLISDGELAGPVRDLRFTQSYPRALAPGAVLGLGRWATMQPDSWDSAWWTAPPVRLAGWNFTGGAAG
ncbi:TldD/PmbA family protein [Plantactinospora sp. KBS50]|uniref:TldD/PmbA family protein n=1 Tax=Plantactinospora sp. KBS50 TaxID=2024580 RepID=UPI000BAABDCB|nr:metallopeptidase TldD-related protein [Plantactinospora sp. KBS50]ASW56652.1 peptidase U62 [Plantactinospora sp. KBS50]